MKKMLLLATAATLLSMNANANMMQDMKPYIGLDYVYTDADISKVDHVSMYKHKFDSANINIGMRTCYMGVEAYYQMSTKEKKTVLDTYKTKTDFYSFGADLMGYLPVYLGWPAVFAQSWACAGAAAVSLAVLWWPLGRRELQC